MNRHNPQPRIASAPRNRSRRACRSARNRGAVIVLALLGAFMMAGMLAYVFNAGRHAQVRQETQNAADATAVSSAGYIARSFNTVAMNNVEMTRLIGAVQVLDSVPLATEYTLLDVEAYLDSVRAQQSNGGTGSPAGDAELGSYARRLAEQQAVLDEMDRLFNRGGFDVETVTYYDALGRRGEMWAAMESLDAINLATMEQLSELTQITAIETGRACMDCNNEEEVAAVAPFSTQFLWQRSDIDDFRDPVIVGQLPNSVDDRITNRGPFDTIFGWHGFVPPPDNTLPGGGGPVRPDTTTTDNADSPWSNPSDPFQGTTQTNTTPVAYRTYGMRDWLLNQFMGRVNGGGQRAA